MSEAKSAQEVESIKESKKPIKYNSTNPLVLNKLGKRVFLAVPIL